MAYNISLSLQHEYHAFWKLVDRFKDCKIKVAYEAGPCGFWLYDRLSEDGIETIVVPSSLILIEFGNQVKTDKRDSRKLTKLLDNNMLKRVYVPNEADRVDRGFLRTRLMSFLHICPTIQLDCTPGVGQSKLE